MNIFLFSARSGQQVRAEKETVPRMLHVHTAIEKKKGFFTIFFFDFLQLSPFILFPHRPKPEGRFCRQASF